MAYANVGTWSGIGRAKEIRIQKRTVRSSIFGPVYGKRSVRPVAGASSTWSGAEPGLTGVSSHRGAWSLAFRTGLMERLRRTPGSRASLAAVGYLPR